MNKFERIKLWSKKNQDTLIVAGIGSVVVIGLIVVGVKADMAYQKRMTAKLNAYIDELNALHQAELPQF